MSKDIKVLMVEDHTMTRMGLSLMLERAEGITLLDAAETGLEGVQKAKLLNPDVILMDIGLPEIDGIEATKRIKSYNEDIKILMFTSRDSENDILDAFQSGADGYIQKGATQEQTELAIKTVAEGCAWMDPSVARVVLSNIQKSNSQPIVAQQKNGKDVYGLTERELEVLALIVNGLSNKEISDTLVISYATAKAHVHNILQKLEAGTRVKAIKVATQEGLV